MNVLSMCIHFVNRYVILHVVDHSMIGSNESLGQVILQLAGFDLEQGCQSNFALADLVSFRSLMVVLAARLCAQSKIEHGFHYDACPLI